MRKLTDSHKEQYKNISAEFITWFEAVGNKLLAHDIVGDETWHRYFETKNKFTRVTVTADGVTSCEFHLEEKYTAVTSSWKLHGFIRVAIMSTRTTINSKARVAKLTKPLAHFH
jgi:hypothetical protein